jgi:hypothetical protein
MQSRRLLFVFLLVPAMTAAQGPTTQVTGTVVDSEGRPVNNAVVVIDPLAAALRTRSDDAGRFRITGVDTGRHELQVVRIGFRPHRAPIDVPAAGLDISVTMERLARQLDTVSIRVARTGIHGLVATRGMALLPHDPRPLRGATVEILDSPHRTSTGADGRFSVEALGEGAWSLLVRLDRYQSRMVSVYVPADGGLDVEIVLDSTIADWQRRDDMELREISSRIREATNPSAFVSAAELAGPEGMTLDEALRNAPSTLSRGLITKDDVTCIYIDGTPRPGMTAKDILADEVHAVEVYGINARGGTQAPMAPWPKGAHCGTGMRLGPFFRPPGFAPPAGSGGRSVRGGRQEMDNIARVVVAWLKRGQ